MGEREEEKGGTGERERAREGPGKGEGKRGEGKRDGEGEERNSLVFRWCDHVWLCVNYVYYGVLCVCVHTSAHCICRVNKLCTFGECISIQYPYIG